MKPKASSTEIYGKGKDSDGPSLCFTKSVREFDRYYSGIRKPQNRAAFSLLLPKYNFLIQKKFKDYSTKKIICK